MGQSLSQLYIHLTFGTKNRYPFIEVDIKEKLHAYMAGILKKLESPALIINSVSDHVHILFRLSKNHALKKVVEEVKKQSSKWIKTEGEGLEKFAWQTGYGAFSVSSSKVETVESYIINQNEHHMKLTYQEEVERFLSKYNIGDYNEKFFWR